MSMRNKVETANARDCDWSFADDPERYHAFLNSCAYWAPRFGIDRAELQQEAALWLAVRPGRSKTATSIHYGVGKAAQTMRYGEDAEEIFEPLEEWTV